MSMRSGLVLALSLAVVGAAAAQTPIMQADPPTAAARPVSASSADEPVPRAERAKARRECLADNVALTGADLRSAMRDCIQAKFPNVQLYARDGLTRDGKPTAASVRAACKTRIDATALAGTERTAALTACFNEQRPDLAQRATCRKEARERGLEGEPLRRAIDSCAREANG